MFEKSCYALQSFLASFSSFLEFSDLKFSIKGVVYDSGESMLIFELNSHTNTPLPSVLLQTRTSTAQHYFVLRTSTSCDKLYRSF